MTTFLLLALVSWVTPPPVAWTVPLGPEPAALAVAERSGRVFVADGAADTVTMFDARTGKTLATADVGHMPVALAVDAVHGRVFTFNACVVSLENPEQVCQDGDGSVSILDLATGTSLGTVRLSGGATAAAVDERAGRLFVASYGDDTVSVLDARSGRVLAAVGLAGAPQAITVDAPLHHLFVSTYSGGRSSVRLFDSRSDAALATMPVGRYVGSLLCDPRAGRVLVASDDDLYLLDARTGRTLRRIRAGGAPLAVDERAGRALIGGQGRPLLIATGNGAPLGPVRDVGVMAKRALVAGDETAGHFYVATDRGLAVLDSHSGRLVRLLALPDSPVAVAADAATHRLFLLSAGHPWRASADSGPPLVRWLRQALPWLPLAPPPRYGAGGTLSVLDTTRR